MYLAPEGEELEIAKAAADFLTDIIPRERLHSPGSADMASDVREDIGSMGWFALAVPERDGGSGLSAVEHVLFFREVGRQCGPVDLLAQSLAARICADPDRRKDILAGTSAVTMIVSDGDRWRGIGLPGADYGLLCNDTRASLIPLAATTVESVASLDPANSIWKLAELPEVVEQSNGGVIALFCGLGIAAMLVGVSEAALDMIVDYAKVRETFGRKIGSYQAVRHSCADMAVKLEATRAQLWYAAAAAKEGRNDAAPHLDAAKHLANETALMCTDLNIQLHGGIGVTDEHDAHLLLKHAMLLSRLFGTRRALLDRLLHASLED